MQMYSVILPTIIASLCATGCSLLLVRRGPSRRLRYLTLTVGLMSFAQTANLLHMQGLWAGGSLYVVHVHQSLVAGLSLLALYLLSVEVYDRNYTDRRLRLTEHELLGFRTIQAAGARKASAVERTPNARPAALLPAPVMAQDPGPQPFGLLALAANLGSSRGLSPAPSEGHCETCLSIIHELAAGWQAFYAARVERRPENAARDRLARAMRSRLHHEAASGHDIMDEQSTIVCAATATASSARS
ncbi:MAG: hypothetical protein JNL62_02490 [Bryobacterales bacterium]|nr:hypothetical protein [Bryobacterales bacterium]